MRKIVQSIFLFILFLAISIPMLGNRWGKDNLSHTYDDCTGELTVTFSIYEVELRDRVIRLDDYWRDFRLVVQESDGWNTVIAFDNKDGSDANFDIGNGVKYRVDTFGREVDYKKAGFDDTKGYYNIEVVVKDIDPALLGSDIRFSVKGTHLDFTKSNERESTKTYFYHPGEEAGLGNPDNREVEFIEYSTLGINTSPNIGIPSTTDCDKIVIGWSNNFGSNSCPSNKIATKIYRRQSNPEGSWEEVDEVPSTMTSYEDNNTSLVPGIDYDYAVAYVFKPNSDRVKIGPRSTIMKGRRLGPLAPPSNLVASDDKCDIGEVNITWESLVNPEQGFVLERATNRNFTGTVDRFNVPGNVRNFRNENLPQKTSYWYRIKSKNKCGDLSEPSNVDSGVSPSVPTTPSRPILVVDDVNNIINVQWIDNSEDEDEFIVVRSIVGAGSEEFPIPTNDKVGKGGQMVYADSEVDPCQTYSYRIRSKNACGQSNDSEFTQERLNPNLTSSFDEGSFDASKGYYTNRVQLEWTLRGNDANFIDNYNISRRTLGSKDNFILLQEVSGGGIYNDLIADAGILYEYRIFGLANCESDRISTDTVYAIGFRSQSGLVTGNVSYEGGNPVGDVKIQAESSSQGKGKSVAINKGKIEIKHSNFQNVGSTLFFESWFRPEDYSSDFTVIEKNGSYKFSFEQSSGDFKLELGGDDIVSVTADSFEIDQWSHISFEISDSMYIYKGGNKLASKSLSVSPFIFSNPNESIELFNAFEGKVTEMRLWNSDKDSLQVLRDAARFVVGDEAGLIIYLPMNEGFGNYLYDRSKRSFSTFNKHDGLLTGGATFDDDLPTMAQLSHAAYTDTLGNYILNLPYTNAGENYELIPIFKTHEFDPAKRLLFVGDGSTVINNIDFLDKSSFLMSGIVKYEGTNCFVENARVKIDGELVQVNGSIVRTGEDGKFDIQVPIGEHYIEVEKNGHTFSRGRWPEVEGEAWDFQEPLSEVTFLDNTQMRLVGRAVGGSREAEKIPVIGGSVNNIGITQIILKHNTCGWETGIETNPYRLDTIIYTDSLTGVYDVYLPPWNFTVDDLSRKNEKVTPNDFFGNTIEPIDLRYEIELGVIQALKTERDTTYPSLTSTEFSVDSVQYHKEVNFVHYAKPSIGVVNLDGTPFLGESSFQFEHSEYDNELVDLTSNRPLFPVLYSFKNYNVLIRLFEEYINIDQIGFVPDTVPIIRGKIEIDNKLAAEPVKIVTSESLDTLSGIVPYDFIGALPDVLENTVDPNYSFTKVFNITYVNPRGEDEAWKPFKQALALGDENPSDNFRAYLFGSKFDEGTDHVVQGPNEIDYVLRDPPVGNGFASITEGVTTNTFTNWSVSAGGGFDIDKSVKLGPKYRFSLPGIILATFIENTTVIELGNSSTGGVSNTTQTVREFTKTLSTSDIANNIGDGSDLFIGTSSIYLNGTSTSLGLFPVEACSDSDIICSGNQIGNYKVGRTRNYTILDKELDTEFILSKTDIINYEIPKLENLRDELLKNDSLYESIVPESSPLFGLNNDDPKFQQDACRCYHWEDNDPPSYRFLGNRDSIDRVRKFNEEISNWKKALAANEFDKAISNKVVNRFSFDGGGSSLELSSSVSNITSKAETWEVNFSETVKLMLGTEINGLGFETEQSIMLTQSSTGDTGTETDSTTTISYTLSDEDIWDRYTVEVIESSRGWGPIFKVVSGETSCPHVGPLISEYYNPGTPLSGGTIRLEQPLLKVDNPILRNVPEDDVAEFVFRLGNGSSQGWSYRLGLLNQTNEGGAIIVNSGTSELGSDFVIGSQQEISQVIQIVKGGSYINDSLLFVLASTCQYDIGNDFDEDIADSVYVSVSFTPGCTDISLSEPENNWVLNSNFNDEMEIVVSDYNVNNSNLKSFNIEYKPSNEPDWIPLQTYYLNKEDYDNSVLQNKDTIALDANGTQFLWKASRPGIPDTEYDLRATADCVIATSESEVSSGYMDRDRIEVFGTPSPADGILDPDSDILLTMNETIETGGISADNFDVRAVLNGTELRHETSLSFDGSNDSLVIPEYQLQDRSLTIEFWLKRNGTGEQIILSQGSSVTDQLAVSFTSSNHLQFKLGKGTITSNMSIVDENWHHYAIVYEKSTQDAEIFIDYSLDKTDNNFGGDYNSTGPVYVGVHFAGNVAAFNGFIHELRLWGVARSVGEIASKGLVTLSGRETGLIGNWPLDEGYGSVAFEKVRSRHGRLFGPDWNILPQNHAVAFDGSNDYLEALDGGKLGLDEETDITIEAWFKTASSSNQSIISNGKADGSRPEDFAWNVFVNSNGAIVIENDGFELSTPAGFNDNKWHHVSAVIERTRAVSIYMDGNLVTTGNAANYKGFLGPKLWIGCRGWFEGPTEMRDYHFNGALDEIRIWNTARLPEQIHRDFVHQLKGDELGLQAYFPFDGIIESLGVFTRNPDLTDASNQMYNLTSGGTTNADFIIDAPPIKLPRLVEQVNFTYAINNDKVFIEVTDPPARVENVTLDVTVRRLRDRAGNFMKSPETWIAYVDKNQVFWDTEYFKFEKKLEDQLSFIGKIKNTGGSQERFSLSNLPSWLTASPSSGLIDPNSTVEVEFKVQPLLNIGEYEQDIFVSTESFGFNERLLLDLKVTVDPPVWEVDPDAFDHSMNITGELFINDVISTDPEDMVSVWINDELRGVSHVELDPASGKNLVFLTISSNVSSGETLEFRAWDASRGRLLKGLLPDDIVFIGGGVLNGPSNPLPIKATVLTQLNYVLREGWNWISFPLDHPDLLDVNLVLKELSPTDNDQIKSQDQGKPQFLSYSGGGWSANDTSVNTNLAYKIKVAKADTFRYEGIFVDPSTEPISIIEGWNWIGVKSEFIIDVPSALASLDPQTGDIIKGHRSFAIYDSLFGWSGNLDFLQPQKGYMLKYNRTDSLFFPGNLNARSKPETHLKSRSHKGKEYARLEKSLNYVSGKYSNTMSLIAAVDDCIVLDTEGVLQLSQWSLVAHAGDECRGVVESTWIESIGEYRYYLSIEGNSSVPLTFKLVHNSNGKEIILNQGMNFETNGVVGMNSSPYLFSCVAPSDCINSMLYQNADIDMSQTDITRQVLTELQSNALLPTGRVFRFKAGQSIEFMGEFEVTRGAILEAYIEECIKGNE